MHLQVVLSHSQLLALNHLFDIRSERELPERPSESLRRDYPSEPQFLCALSTDAASGLWLACFAQAALTLHSASVHREPGTGRERWRALPGQYRFTFRLDEPVTRDHAAAVCTLRTPGGRTVARRPLNPSPLTRRSPPPMDTAQPSLEFECQITDAYTMRCTIAADQLRCNAPAQIVEHILALDTATDDDECHDRNGRHIAGHIADWLGERLWRNEVLRAARVLERTLRWDPQDALYAHAPEGASYPEALGGGSADGICSERHPEGNASPRQRLAACATAIMYRIDDWVLGEVFAIHELADLARHQPRPMGLKRPRPHHELPVRHHPPCSRRLRSTIHRSAPLP